ncbi:MAG: methionyl-tRNA formyltransferase [Eubacterium sp.]|jgi:methionyl-tRNA formyltransferase|nr:methionyl-tRNA formyltransferase [Eubacterium sp.]
MRVVFMGTPDFSVPALEKIAEKHEVTGVVTQQDRPKGRGHKMQFTPVKEKAIELGIPVFQPEKVKNPGFVDILREMNPDVIVVIAFGQILSKEILDLPKHGCINVHASLLPKYRGAAPIQWAVIDGEEHSGVTTMYMAEGLDTGDMIDKKIIKLDEKETGGSLFDKLSFEGGALILETLEKLENNTVKRIPQNDDESTYAGKITKELGQIDFYKSATEIERLIRGLNPWPSAYTHLDGKVLKIWAADVLEQEVKEEPGTICKNNKSLRAATGKGYLDIKELQLEGKKRMDVVSFLNGYQIDAVKFGE